MISKKEFIASLERIVEYNDPEDDYSLYVVDEYCHQNNIDFQNYNELTLKFIGKEKLKREEYEDEGLYGGAFGDEDDYWNYRVGSSFYSKF